ncbi:hypothetical protein MOE20_02255 [Bacillus atrophaeus]|uniref:hypothetical protein n=1 Tax=Bacillus atrophaeus TaxID=1452 RepID=UPI0022809D4B|nr:hypothetical protein [Bacillus atrophaeus]MCY8923472.1 hypothetical protein [Bacillus atrophaeus]
MEEKKLLIAADALVKTGGALHRPVGEATLDMDQALPSLESSDLLSWRCFSRKTASADKKSCKENRDVNTSLLFYEE